MTQTLVGKIVAAHGVKGLVKILPLCEDISLLERSETHALTLKNPLGKYILAEVKGVTDRNGAEALCGCSLFVSRETLPALDQKDSYYYDDLIGLKALTENGEAAGEVIAVYDFGAGDLLEIRPVNGEEPYLLPFTDHYVPTVDMSARTVTIRPLEMI